MVYIDMTKSGRDLTPGTDLWEVAECVSRQSKKKDMMFEIKLARVSNPQDTILDWIMLAGGGWDIGKGKLQAFGIAPSFKGELDPLALVGKRVWAGTVVAPYTDKEGATRESLKVDINALKHNGYQAETDVPPGCALPDETAFPDDGEVPF